MNQQAKMDFYQVMLLLFMVLLIVFILWLTFVKK